MRGIHQVQRKSTLFKAITGRSRELVHLIYSVRSKSPISSPVGLFLSLLNSDLSLTKVPNPRTPSGRPFCPSSNSSDLYISEAGLFGDDVIKTGSWLIEELACEGSEASVATLSTDLRQPPIILFYRSVREEKEITNRKYLHGWTPQTA